VALQTRTDKVADKARDKGNCIFVFLVCFVVKNLKQVKERIVETENFEMRLRSTAGDQLLSGNLFRADARL
jgi:hypothetical protein